MRNLLFAVAFAGLLWGTSATAQQYSAPLYSGSAPGSENWEFGAVTLRQGDGQARYNTRDPRVSVYLPEVGHNTGTAVVLLPGGGLRVLGLDADLRDQVARFNAEGIAVILLEYRTLQLTAAEIERAASPRPASTGPINFPKLEIRNANANPAPDNAELNQVLRLAVRDGQEALRLTRAHATEWHIDPRRVGMIGISAGGGVALGTMMAGDPAASPDFIVSIFGPALQDISMPTEAPPLFLVTEKDHGPVTDGLIALFQMWKDHARPAELHIYDVPVFSMRVSLWGDRMFDWMRQRSLIPTDR